MNSFYKLKITSNRCSWIGEKFYLVKAQQFLVKLISFAFNRYSSILFCWYVVPSQCLASIILSENNLTNEVRLSDTLLLLGLVFNERFINFCFAATARRKGYPLHQLSF